MSVFVTQISNECISASFYPLASFEMYVRHLLELFQKTKKFLSFLVYLNQKWRFCFIYEIYTIYIVQIGHWGKVKLPNFKKFSPQLFFIGYVFDPAYWLLPQKLYLMIFFTIFWGKIVIFHQNSQNGSKNLLILYNHSISVSFCPLLRLRIYVRC